MKSNDILDIIYAATLSSAFLFNAIQVFQMHENGEIQNAFDISCDIYDFVLVHTWMLENVS